MSLGGVLWGTISVFHGLIYPSIIPYGYVVISIGNLIYFQRTRDFVTVRFIQVFISLTLPFLFQWSLGGFFSSGLIMIWSLFSLVASLSYESNLHSLLWWSFFLALIGISSYYQGYFSSIKPIALPDQSLLFLVINVSIVSSLIFLLILYLVGLLKTAVLQSERSNKELQITLSDLQRTQKKLIETEKMASLGVLSAGITHEINNPLNFIKGGIQVLELDLKEGKPVNELEPYLNVINDGVERATTIVKSLSHFSRESTDMHESCDVHAIIDNCLLMLESKTRHKIKVLKEFGIEHFKLIGNEGRLHQAFLNILANAEQAILHSGEIKISTELDREIRKIIIKDSGSGIEPEILDKINDPFFTTKPPGQGTGLGLSIAYNIVREHKGVIEVISQPGMGTTFTLSF
ncbi:MAG: ATP-binding protein [Cytophagales bacterium]|nr:ATP-binding protein [Cytophagales bacterium]